MAQKQNLTEWGFPALDKDLIGSEQKRNSRTTFVAF